jgi:hypothetical protein
VNRWPCENILQRISPIRSDRALLFGHLVVAPTEMVVFKSSTDGKEADACDAAGYPDELKRRRHESIRVVG